MLANADVVCDKPAPSCPTGCTCEASRADGTVVRCTRQTRVPDGLPADTVELLLDGGALNELDAASLRALAPLRRLAKLDLSYNSLRSLPPFAFANNTNLQKLCAEN